jgi:hypothetical protein
VLLLEKLETPLLLHMRMALTVMVIIKTLLKLLPVLSRRR